MTVEQIRKIFPDATDEQIKQLMSASGEEQKPNGGVSDEELQTLKDKAKKFDDSEAEKLTNEEQLKKALAAAENARSENSRLLNRTKAEGVFVKSGLSENDYSSFIDNIVSEDEEKTLDLANAIAAAVISKIHQTEANIKAKAQEETPPPSGGGTDSENESSEGEKLARKLGKRKSETDKNSKKVFSYYGG